MRAWAVSLAQGLCCLCCPHRSSPGQMLPGPLPGLRAALLLLPTCHGCSHTCCPSRTNHGHDRQGSFSRLPEAPAPMCAAVCSRACHADGSQSLCLKGGGRESCFYTPDRPRDCRDDCCPQHCAKNGFYRLMCGHSSILPISSWLRRFAIATCRFSPSPRSSQVSPGRARL